MPLRARRAGATILEVLFSIFVVIVGLMGIASLIPIAAKNAYDSNSANNAITQGRIWMEDFETRGYNKPANFTQKGVGFNWQWRVDSAPIAGVANFSKTQGGGITSTLSDPRHSLRPGNLQRVRTWPQMSVCIDPVFMSDRDVVTSFTLPNGTESAHRIGAYRAAVFPYYEDGYNPTETPAAETGSAPWTDQPRMLRASLGGPAGTIPAALAEELFFSSDDTSITRDDGDKTIPPSRVFKTVQVENAAGEIVSEYSKADRESDYSWIATLTPEFSFSGSPAAVTNDYVLSLVIMRKRDRQWMDMTQLRLGNPPVTITPTGLPQGERLVWVVPLSGPAFVNGNGGRVRLIGNSFMDDSVHVGDWIMLGKHVGFAPAAASTPLTQGFSVFRWFRIVAVDEGTRRGPLAGISPSGADPFGNNSDFQVWSRDVVLEGTDWSFAASSPSDANGNSALTPTTGTLMSNVVTVIERNITVD